MTYNMTMVGDFGFGTYFSTLNELTEGAFLGFIMVAVFFLIMLALKKWDFSDVLLVDSLICLVLCTLLASGGLLNWYYPIGFAFVLAFGYLATVFRDK